MSKKLVLGLLLLAFSLVLTLELVPGVNGSFAGTPMTPTASGWKVYSYEVGNKISMVSANDGWILHTTAEAAYLYRWNGVSWTEAGTLTHPQFIHSGDIEMVSATDGWIILGGPAWGFPYPAESVIYRWNGSTWSLFTTITDPDGVSLATIDMVSPTDGWATAARNFGAHFYRWDGTTWQKFSSVSLSNYAYLKVDMISATDGWAAGGFQGFIFHWDGTAWHEVASPVATILSSVAMVSAVDGWIVGWDSAILRWNGSAWTAVTSPVPGAIFADVSMVSATDGWIIGKEENDQDYDPNIILHWDGNSWLRVASPTHTGLRAVEMVSPFEGWIIGDGVTLRYGPTALSINYQTGQPGSYFNLMGSYFPANSPVEVVVNGQTLASAVSTDASGQFTFTLSTSQADPGFYAVTAGVDPSATIGFTLSPSEPLRLQEGNWTTIDVPAGIALTRFLSLPFIQK